MPSSLKSTSTFANIVGVNEEKKRISPQAQEIEAVKSVMENVVCGIVLRMKFGHGSVMKKRKDVARQNVKPPRECREVQ